MFLLQYILTTWSDTSLIVNVFIFSKIKAIRKQKKKILKNSCGL